MTPHKRRRARLLASLAAPALLFAPLPALVQQAEGAQAPSFLGRIALGFGRALTAIDTPQAVSTLDRKILTASRPQSRAICCGPFRARQPLVATA